jgi:hypothetical protein
LNSEICDDDKDRKETPANFKLQNDHNASIISEDEHQSSGDDDSRCQPDNNLIHDVGGKIQDVSFKEKLMTKFSVSNPVILESRQH